MLNLAQVLSSLILTLIDFETINRFFHRLHNGNVVSVQIVITEWEGGITRPNIRYILYMYQYCNMLR